MKNTAINLIAVRKTAAALGELNARVIYVGGAVVSLYINDPSAEDVRPTKDIDIVMEIATNRSAGIKPARIDRKRILSIE